MHVYLWEHIGSKIIDCPWCFNYIIDKIIKFKEEENVIDDNNSEISENDEHSDNSDGEAEEDLSKDNLLKKSKNELKVIAEDNNVEILNFKSIKKSELVELILDDI